jgi:alkylation response protein AidB-like acyl-CoA dehydrogenase
MDFSEQAEHNALRAAVMAVTRSFGAAYYAEHAREHRPTGELWQALGKQGFVGVNMPEEYGGGGGGLSELAVVCEASAAEGCPLLLLLVSSAISGEVLARHGTAEQQRTWLPAMADGKAKVVFAITEPDAGSNSHRLSTTATGDGDGWRLSGTKYYISGVDEAEAILVVARTGTNERTGHGLLSLFLIPTDAPGLTATPLPVAAQLPERQFTLFFDDVRVEAHQLVGEEDNGFEQVFHGLNPERVTGAAMCVGIGRYYCARPASTRTPGRSGTCRSAVTRAFRTRWPRPRSKSNSPR